MAIPVKKTPETEDPIIIEKNINHSPVVNFEKCTGCGLCLGMCPGLAIFLVDLSKGNVWVTLPYELFPPKDGETVDLLDRSGKIIGEGIVEKVKGLKQHDRTLTVTLNVTKTQVKKVRCSKLHPTGLIHKDQNIKKVDRGPPCNPPTPPLTKGEKWLRNRSFVAIGKHVPDLIREGNIRFAGQG